MRQLYSTKVRLQQLLIIYKSIDIRAMVRIYTTEILLCGFILSHLLLAFYNNIKYHGFSTSTILASYIVPTSCVIV